MKQLLILIFLFVFGTGHTQTLNGIVTDSISGEPIPYVFIYVEGSSLGTNTGPEGEYTLDGISGNINLIFSNLAYNNITLNIDVKGDTSLNIVLVPGNFKMSEVLVEAKKTKIGNQIIKKVIANKSKILTDNSTFSNDNYIKTQMERWREASEPEDSIVVEEGWETVYLSEVAARQHYSNRKYKAEVKGELINASDKALRRTTRMDVDRSFRGSNQSIQYNPIEFFRNSRDANIEIYENFINNPTLSDRPITSPLGNGAFVNYRFRLQEINIIKGDSIFTISVEPIFKKAPLFNGLIVVNGNEWVVKSATLNLKNNVINAFRDFSFEVSYNKIDRKYYKAVDRSIHYTVNMGKNEYKVNTQIVDSNFEINPNFPKNFFGSEIINYSEQALDRDTTIWSILRPVNISVSKDERTFIMEQDSIWNYEHSNEYYMAQDSDYNKITLLNVLWSGVNYRKRAAGITLNFNSLVQSIRPLGVGGYRQSLGGRVEKEFPSNNSLGFRYDLNYGFNNQDLKGSLRVGYTYMPQKFARFFVSVKDNYELITIYESLQNIISRGNYVRNQGFSIGHVMEIVNGLYATGEIKYADKRSIENLSLAGWTDFVFGEANAPSAFERYKSFIFEAELVYKFGQKYITRGRKKIIIGNNYPTLNLKYNKGFPVIGGSEVNFDHLELRLSQEMPNTKIGNTNWLILAGKYLNTKSLRFIEYKYFRGSTPYLFADPLRDYQLLGPTLSTNNSYIQGMVIHHFNGFIMDKIPGINWLQLELIAGAAALSIPDQNFLHAEVYVGLGRKFTIMGEQFQFAIYAASSDNTIDKFDLSYKLGVNFYNAFSGKWTY